MAEDDKSPDSTEATTVKRRLRPAPETMRERTVKLQNQDSNSQSKFGKAMSSFWTGFTWPVRAFGRLLARLWQRLERYKFFRVVGYILVPRYIRNSWKELRLVTWPDFRTSWKLTYAVLIFSLIFGAVVAVLDFGLDKLFKEIFAK